ncbi:hypothetical protein GCM10009556_104840 [Acrocarpospora pleiomorpha]
MLRGEASLLWAAEELAAPVGAASGAAVEQEARAKLSVQRPTTSEERETIRTDATMGASFPE